MNKLDLKTYQGKNRIYQKVPATTSIQRLYQWNGSEYVPGKYEARRYNERKERIKQAFDTLPEARAWQQGTAPEAPKVEVGMNLPLSR